MTVYFISVTFVYVILDFIVLLQCATSSYAAPTDADQQKPTTTNDFTPALDKWEMNPDLKSLWVYRPPPIQSQPTDDQLAHRVVLRSPHLLTKLAKPFSYGVDSFFRKPYFEPFERRPKPVTLVAFRKNGILPRFVADPTNPMSSEVAELQSPFNDIGNLWQDDTLLFNL